MNRSLILGTRGSALALAQTQIVRALIHRAFPALSVEIKIIKTSGDKKIRVPLAQSGIKGLFTKELEQALIRKQIDLAIHSLKDLPTDLPAGLMLAAVTEREDPADVLVCHPLTQKENPKLIYTSSPRRAIQAKLLWPNCEIKDIRGNVETRVHKLSEGSSGDALLLAAAGLKRLDFLRGETSKGNLHGEPSFSYRKLSILEMIPAPGQAAIGIETRSDDGETQERLKSINHSPSFGAVTAERAFLDAVGGGCSAPIAAHAVAGFDGLRLIAMVAQDPKHIWRGEKSGSRRDAENLGKGLAEEYHQTKKT